MGNLVLCYAQPELGGMLLLYNNAKFDFEDLSNSFQLPIVIFCSIINFSTAWY